MKKRALSLALALVMCLSLTIPVSAVQPDEVYQAMIALKSQYPEGMPWTNDNFYEWNGGIYSGGGGCVAFSFLLSDAAFGDLPARMLNTFSFSDVQVGDILRINNDTHNVIVLEVHPDHVVIAEGNYNSSIHWGRTLSKAEVEQADYLMTRYPEATAQPSAPGSSSSSTPGSSSSGKTVVSEKNGYTLTFHNLLRTETLTFNVGHYSLGTGKYVSAPERLTIYVVEDNSPITFTVIPGRGYDFSRNGPWNWTSDELGWDAYMQKLEQYAYMYGPEYSWHRGENFLRENEFGNDPVPVDEITDNPFDLTVKPTDEAGSAGYGSAAWLDGMYGVLYTCESDYEKMLAAVAQEPEKPTATKPEDTKPTTPPAVTVEDIPASGTAYASTQTVTVDGKATEFQMYALKDANGNGTNYIKLRDMAYVLNGTAAQFSVGYDSAAKTISVTSGQAYTSTGTEMTTPFSGDRSYTGGAQAVQVNGKAVDMTAITLLDDAGGGYNYFKLRDLGAALGFNVGWSRETGVFIESDKPYAG